MEAQTGWVTCQRLQWLDGGTRVQTQVQRWSWHWALNPIPLTYSQRMWACLLHPQIRGCGVLPRVRPHTQNMGYRTLDTHLLRWLVTRKQDALSGGVRDHPQWGSHPCGQPWGWGTDSNPSLSIAGCVSWFPHLWFRHQTTCLGSDAEGRRDMCRVPAVLWTFESAPLCLFQVHPPERSILKSMQSPCWGV